LNLFIYCCGGFGREVAEIAHRLNEAHHRWDRIAFLDDAAADHAANGADVYRLETAVERFGATQMEAVIANGEPAIREMLLERLEESGICLSTVIADAAVISSTANIGAGAVIFPQCYISSRAILGRNIAMVAGSMVGHDTVVGNNCVISGHVNIGGGCSIGDESYLGMGVQVKETTHIGKGSIVGMGSIVFADIPDDVIALGNPCRALRPNTSKRIFNQRKRDVHDNQRTL
jgi:sugar O-acyltransferase (sialic acid O-acetyltransferase NeuD family)